jgi:hypothetical protein
LQARRYSDSSSNSRALLSVSSAWVIWSAVVFAPAGEIDRADRLARGRVVDGHPGAGQILQVLGVMLVAEHVHGTAALQGRADPVGADELLGVAEPRGELHAVEMPFQVAVAGQPDEHHARRVGQDDADRLAVEVVAEVPQHRQGVTGQRRVEVGIPDVVELDVVRRHVPVPGAPPGGQDRVAHLVCFEGVGGEEPLPGLGQPVAVRDVRSGHGASFYRLARRPCLRVWVGGCVLPLT